MEDSIKNEIEFCNELELEKNEFNQFIYQSKNGRSIMNLPYVLQDYKQWLIDNNIVKEIK